MNEILSLQVLTIWRMMWMRMRMRMRMSIQSPHTDKTSFALPVCKGAQGVNLLYLIVLTLPTLSRNIYTVLYTSIYIATVLYCTLPHLLQYSYSSNNKNLNKITCIVSYHTLPQSLTFWVMCFIFILWCCIVLYCIVCQHSISYIIIV